MISQILQRSYHNPYLCFKHLSNFSQLSYKKLPRTTGPATEKQAAVRKANGFEELKDNESKKELYEGYLYL